MTITHDDMTLGEEWLAAPRRSRIRLVIVASLIASVCFLGGALTQKNFGADEAASGLPAGAPEGFGGAAGGFPAGGFPGADPQGTDTLPIEADAGVDTADQVIGTVIKKDGDVWLIEDLGGRRHEVVVARDTDVVRESELTPSEVTAGDRVQITGVERDHQLEAADITLR